MSGSADELRVLVTNDDGVASEGLWVLARSMVAAGHHVIVVAPEHDMTGMGTAVGAMRTRPIRYRELSGPGLDGVTCVAVDAPPAVCVMATQLQAFGPPVQMVVSGINPGVNYGRNTLHSGTVSAALTAANNGAAGVAVSLGFTDAPAHWQTAAAFAQPAVEWVAARGGREVLNVNVPDVPLDSVRGVTWASLAAWGTTRTRLVSKVPGQLVLEDDQDAPPRRLIPGSDLAALHDGWVAVTGLVGIRATEPHDAADHLAAILGRTI